LEKIFAEQPDHPGVASLHYPRLRTIPACPSGPRCATQLCQARADIAACKPCLSNFYPRGVAGIIESNLASEAAARIQAPGERAARERLPAICRNLRESGSGGRKVVDASTPPVVSRSQYFNGSTPRKPFRRDMGGTPPLDGAAALTVRTAEDLPVCGMLGRGEYSFRCGLGARISAESILRRGMHQLESLRD